MCPSNSRSLRVCRPVPISTFMFGWVQASSTPNSVRSCSTSTGSVRRGSRPMSPTLYSAYITLAVAGAVEPEERRAAGRGLGKEVRDPQWECLRRNRISIPPPRPSAPAGSATPTVHASNTLSQHRRRRQAASTASQSWSSSSAFSDTSSSDSGFGGRAEVTARADDVPASGRGRHG
jgi:hypothetical protein